MPKRKLISFRHYLLKAYYEWILDNRLTPYLTVNICSLNVSEVSRYTKDGKVVFNISPQAVHGLIIEREQIQFSACFRGIARKIQLPIGVVKAIYAYENGIGVSFITSACPSGEEGLKKPALCIDHTTFSSVEPLKTATKKPELTLVK